MQAQVQWLSHFDHRHSQAAPSKARPLIPLYGFFTWSFVLSLSSGWFCHPMSSQTMKQPSVSRWSSAQQLLYLIVTWPRKHIALPALQLRK